MKVMLVNPPPYKVQEAYYDTPPYPRTSLAFLAGMLRANSIDVAVLDCKYDRVTYEKAIELICQISPNIIGYTAFTNEIIQAGHMAKNVKERLPFSKQIIGGVHASILPERTLREFRAFNYACVGEGEATIVELVKHLMISGSNKTPESIKGIAYLDESDSYVFGGERNRIGADDNSLDSIPIPAWDMFRKASEYILHTQRGCPYHCPFCVNPNGRLVRKESPDKVVKQVKELYEKFGCKKIYFGDEIFTLDRDRVIAICDGLIENGLHKKVKWACATHINSIDEVLASAMKKAGCYSVGLGIEAGDPKMLQEINKGTTVDKILDVVSGLKRSGLSFNSFFILGQPFETEESARQTIDFAVKINASNPIFGIMVPYPGTKIWKMAKADEGGYVLRSECWNDYNKQIGNSLEFEGVSRKTLERLQFYGYVSVFLKNRRYFDFIKFCWGYRKIGFAVLKKLILQSVFKTSFGR